MQYAHKNFVLQLSSLLILTLILTGVSLAQEDVVAKTADGVLPKATETDAEKTDAEKTDKEIKPEVVKDEEPVEKIVPKYEFSIEHSIPYTKVKSQDSTGTCWSFATASFIESELIRQEKGQHDLSEMFIVKNIYKDKAQNYVLRQGKANFSQGALAHDFINSAHHFGLVPEENYSGREDNSKRHDHAEMEVVMNGFLEAVAKQKKLSPKWKIASDKILDTYLGDSPARFTYRDHSYSPKEFSESLGFNGKDYQSITSFTHHPFGEAFVLELPDNYSNGSFQNVPIDELMETIDFAIENGFSVAWDGDVSEKGFSATRGIAVLPSNSSRRDLFTRPGEEQVVTQEMRQDAFTSLATTDDHLMHLVGISRDTEGNKYYVVKNSWGEIGKHKGFIHLSEAFVRLKTVAVIVHKDAVTAMKEAKEASADEKSEVSTATPGS
jgi:bleomycin hydrolase